METCCVGNWGTTFSRRLGTIAEVVCKYLVDDTKIKRVFCLCKHAGKLFFKQHHNSFILWGKLYLKNF